MEFGCTFGAWVKAQRKGLGLTQREFSQMVFAPQSRCEKSKQTSCARRVNWRI